MNYKKEPIHIVYPLERSMWEQELKYSLRSLEKHLKEPFDVTIIGYLPPYINESTITHIKINDDEFINCSNRQAIINRKIFKATDLYEDFVLFNDDIYVIKDITRKELQEKFYLQELDYKNIRLSDLTNFQKVIYSGYLRALKLGIKGKLLNHVCHIPYYYNSKILKEADKVFDITNGVSIIENAYYNYIGGDFKQADSIRIGFHKYNRDISLLNNISIERYIFHNDDGLTTELKEYIENKFNKKSRFEK